MDKTLLSIMKHRADYEKLIHVVNLQNHEDHTKFLLREFGGYFKEFTHQVIQPDTFLSWLFQYRCPDAKAEVKSFYQNVLAHVGSTEADPESRRGIVRRLKELDYATELGNMIQTYQDGLEIDLYEAVKEQTELFRQDLHKTGKMPLVTDSIEDIMDEMANGQGFEWRLTCLRKSMGRLILGKFGIVAARPDAGKTSFCASEVTNFATQVIDDRPILWMNNEGKGQEIIYRIHQAATGFNDQEMEKNRGKKLQAAYAKALGCGTYGEARQRLQVADIHGWTTYDLENLFEETRPCLMLFDMLDNVRGFEKVLATGTVDARVEALYQWARECQVKYNSAGIATSQLRGDAEGVEYPDQSQLKGSTTAKQGANDFILMVGRSLELHKQNSRFISTPKNKCKGEPGVPKNNRAEVVFDHTIARFHDPVALPKG